MLDEDKVLARANEFYAAMKVEKYGDTYKSAKMQTDTAKAIIKAIVEALNGRVQY